MCPLALFCCTSPIPKMSLFSLSWRMAPELEDQTLSHSLILRYTLCMRELWIRTKMGALTTPFGALPLWYVLCVYETCDTKTNVRPNEPIWCPVPSVWYEPVCCVTRRCRRRCCCEAGSATAVETSFEFGVFVPLRRRSSASVLRVPEIVGGDGAR